MNMPLPTKAKITALVWTGRRRPKVTNWRSRFARREKKLDGAEQSRAHADDAPDDGGDGEGADDAVVVLEGLHGRGAPCGGCSSKLGRLLRSSFVCFLVALLFWCSSMSGRRDGVQVSSYCPVRTAQMNPRRKTAAITMLNGMRRKMTIMAGPLPWDCLKADPAPSRAVRPQANATTVTELTGIRMAQITGDSSPRAAMLTPTML